MAGKTPDWDAIKNEYITTRISQRALAAKHGVSYNTMRKRAEPGRWKEEREKYYRKANAKALAKAESKAAEYKNRIYDLANKMAEQLEELIYSEGVGVGGLKPRDLTGALKDIADILDVKSEAAIREQEARIAKLEAEAKRTTDVDVGREIVVHIDGGSQEWSE